MDEQEIKPNNGKTQQEHSSLDEVRVQMRKQLPSMFARALEAYHEILNASDIEDQKFLAARNQAAKTALMHIQQLVRLGDWAMIDDGQSGHDMQALASLIQEARQEMEGQL